MNKLYAIYVILSSHDNHTYLLSTKEQELEIPIIEIVAPAKLKQEARYTLRNFFTKDSYQFTEECSYNFVDVQEENSLDYLQSIGQFSENNLYILYGGIAKFNSLQPSFYWKKLIFDNEYFGYTTNKALNLIIDNVINKTAI